MHFQVVGTQAHAFRTQKCHRAQVGFVQVVLTNRSALGFVDHVFAERHFHVQDVGGVEQPVGVFFQPENCRAIRGVVRPHTFKAAKAVMQGVSEYMGFGFSPGNHFTIQPDKAIAISHRHFYSAPE